MAKTIDRIDGPGCFQQALVKARFGHRCWVFYRDADGPHAEVKSPASIKRALLASGTKGNWTLICEDGTPMKGFWYLGLIQLRNMSVGVY